MRNGLRGARAFYWSRGTEALRRNDYASAILLYQAAKTAAPELAKLIDLNIKLVESRLKARQTPHHVDTTKEKLPLLNGDKAKPSSDVSAELIRHLLKKIVSVEDIALVKSSNFFDEAWYIDRYVDAKALDIDPVEHYLRVGQFLGYSPSPKFCSPSYLKSHRDIKAAGIEPLLHYLKSGKSEGRTIYPVRDGNQVEERKKCRRILTRRNKEWDWGQHAKTVQFLEALPYTRSEDKVSIIMPTYNRAHMISAAIKSVLEQTHANFELIIVDDHSTDDTQNIVCGISDSRINYTKNSRGKGVSSARNAGLDLAKGKWVFFLDSDNTWKRNMIEFALKHADFSQSSAGYCAANIHGDDHETKFILYSEFDFESCVHENFIDLNCFFMRWSGQFKEYRFDENLRRLVDWDLILRVATRTRISGLPFVGVDYYDGTSDRITNKEHVAREAIQDLLNRVRNSARPQSVRNSTIIDSSSYRIAVQLHIYHSDRVPECIEYLRNIRFDFDLFVSTSLDKESEVLKAVRDAYPNARIFQYPNTGADIAPFLELISTFKNYRLLLKIHTKRDVGAWGDAWRRGLLTPILGSPELIDEIVERFRANEHLAMACSADFYKHGVRNSIPASLERLEFLAKELGLSEYQDKNWAFVAGTMFWVRPQIYLELARYMCDSAGYSAEFSRDGAIEHGLERALGLALWQNHDNQVALVSMAGDITEVGLGEGCSMEGVAQTMKRLHSQ
ncbi:glycosyltransferase [Burkholderia sp. Bp9017]|uniref:glycosyltransferase n=1 Tax=Burkholderia TaxID=32008 RepID=UPI000F5D9A57|nr:MULTISPECIES: glycosyltransferase [Burkholderia]RQZ28612.1 glycosyltransferase [Burkholderia sp. Bp9017]RQZ35106.1 glycosyltransferase [Burkholderia sp. Bp9016]